MYCVMGICRCALANLSDVGVSYGGPLGFCCLLLVCMQVVGLYKKLGFVDDPSGIRGMAFQRKKKEKSRLF